MAPLVAAHAAAEFELGREGDLQRCPGETECDRFRSAAGRGRVEKAANACTGCALLPTKLTARDVGAAEAEWMLAAVSRVRRERDSGAGVDLTAITALVWELVQCWDQVDAHCERKLRLETRELLFGRPSF